MRAVVLAHDQFPHHAKTALGILRYADYEVVAVLDRTLAGDRVHDHVPDVQDAPIVASVDEVDTFDTLIIGIAPIGGGFDPSWRSDVVSAIERNCDVMSGLHYFLTDDDEFVALARDHNVDLIDVREPPADLTVSQGEAKDLDTTIALTVGTDCSVGKMTASVEIVDALEADGTDACMIPTGQTGIMIEGWGIAVDRVISDFTAGAVERMIESRAGDHDVVVVEGQGSITHPAYSGVTCSLVHGAMADRLILCHEPGRTHVNGYESFPLLELSDAIDLYERLAGPVAPAEICAVALNTRKLDDAAAVDAIDRVEADLDLPCTDPVRFSADPLAEAIVE